MNKMKKLYILFGVLVALCLVTLGVSKYEAKKEEIKTSGDTVLSIDSDDVTAFSWTSDDSSMAFTKTEDEWAYDKDDAFPVDQDKVDALVANYNDFKAAFIIENVTDYGQYGLDDPVLTVDVTTDEGTTTFEYGDYSQMDNERYVSIGDGNVYLVTNDMTETLNIGESDVIANDELPDVTDVATVDFSGNADYQFYYGKDTDLSVSADDVYFVTGSNLPLDPTTVKTYLRAITNLDLTNYVTYKGDNLSKYGLDDPYLTETLIYKEDDEEKTLTLTIGQDPDEAKNAEEDDEITMYLRVNDSNIIYKLTSDQADSLTSVAYNDLRHKQLITAAFDDITELKITLDGETYELIKDNGKWKYNDEEIDMETLQSELEKLSVDSFTEDNEEGKEEIAITAYVDNDKYPEITIRLFKYDADSCYATIDDEPFGFVNRSDVVDLMETINGIVLK